MAKPLRSENPNPEPVQFTHFGVLNDGERSKGAAITSIAINVTLAAVVLILGMVVKNNPVIAKKVADLTLPPKPLPDAPKPPPPPPPKIKIKLPPPPKMETPKIEMPKPKIETPPEIKPVVMPKPAPVVQPPAPKKVDPPPAPKVVTINNMAASIKNNDLHPSAVRMGYKEIAANNNPSALAKVNLGGGMPGMNASNTGNGPRASAVNLGSGLPGGTNVNSRDRGAVKVAGLGTGVPGGTGRGPGAGPTAVAIAPPSAAGPARPAAELARTMSSPPTVVYKPQPVYTADARDQHIEGNVTVRIRVTTSGAVEVLGVTHGLGHGLDQAAETVARGMRFKPALDNTGRPIEWVGNVNVTFLLS